MPVWFRSAMYAALTLGSCLAQSPRAGEPTESQTTGAEKPVPPPLPGAPAQAGPDPGPGLMEPGALPPPDPATPGQPMEEPRWRTAPSAQPVATTFIPFSTGTASSRPYRYSLPGFYGTAPRNLTSGEGRLAQGPKFRVGVGVGLNDNPTRNSAPDTQNAKNGWTGFSSLDVGYSTQFSAYGQVLLMDLSASTEVFWDGDTDPNYNLDLTLAYQKAFASPVTLSANAFLGYHTQSGYSQVNVAPTTGTGDTALSAGAKLDLSYQWSPQYSSRVSVGVTSVWNLGDSTQPDHWDATVGKELRFRSGRFTWITEGRYQVSRYDGATANALISPTGSNQDADSIYLLLGTEWSLGKWIVSSLRAGVSMRSSENGNGEGLSPYGEFSTAFNPDTQNQFSLNMRYGFEEAVVRGAQTKTFRTGLTYGRLLTSRLSGSISANYLVSESAQGLQDTGDSQIGLDASVALNFRLSSRWSLSGNYNVSRTEGNNGTSEDFIQNRILFSAQTSF